MSAWLRHTGYSSQLQATSPAPPPRHSQQHACPLTGVDALFDEQQYVPYFNKGGKKKPPNAARLQQYRKQTNVARLLWTHGPVWRVELEPGSLKLSSVAESHLTPLPDAATLAQLYAGVQLSEVAPPAWRRAADDRAPAGVRAWRRPPQDLGAVDVRLHPPRASPRTCCGAVDPDAGR